MIFAETDFPDKIIKALKEENLVVFAGTGVSMGEPANLPSFKGLTANIAQKVGKNYYKSSNKRPEVFLYDLKKENKNVHKITRNIIEDSDPEPTSLHRNLLEIFQTQDKVKIVTTNYDRLFEKAAENLVDEGSFSETPEYCSFPTIPLGNELNGIIHLHGSVEEGPSSMILTAEDFSRHYIGRGRCSEFLYDMFKKYVTLFVGYSHDDTIMKYLAWGLSKGENDPRFLCIREDDLERKQKQDQITGLGLEPIPYPKTEDENHRKLREAISEFTDYLSRRALDTKREIKQLVKQSPENLTEREKGRIAHAVKSSDTVQFFTTSAGSEWAIWLEEEGLIDQLFKKDNLDETEKILSNWIAKEIARDSELKLLTLMKNVNSGKGLNRLFALTILHSLRNADNEEILNRWISFLPIEDLFSDRQSTDLELRTSILIEACIKEEAYQAVPELFRALTKPFVSIDSKKSFSVEGGKPVKTSKEGSVRASFNFRFTYRGDFWDDFWDKQIQDNLDYLADDLWTVFFDNLKHYFNLHFQWNKDRDQRDLISGKRYSIEPSRGNEYTEPSDFLIDWLRDILEFYVEGETTKAKMKIETLTCERYPIFRRLAIHGNRLSEEKSADQKLKWLADKAFFLNKRLRLYHETFLLIDEEYNKASENIKERVAVSINNSLECKLEKANSEEEKEWIWHKKIDLLSWLADFTTSTSKVDRLLKKARKKYPDYEPEKITPPEPIGAAKVEWVSQRDSPYSKQDIVDLEPTVFADEYLDWKEKGVKETGITGLQNEVKEISIDNFDWSLELAKTLRAKEVFDDPLWDPLLKGWQDHQFTGDELVRVSKLLNNYSLIKHQHYELSRFLDKAVRNGDSTLSLESIKVADQLADNIWEYLENQEQAGEAIVNAEDPVYPAINSTAGNISSFWLAAISNLINSEKYTPKDIPDHYRGRLNKIVDRSSAPAEVGQVLVAREIKLLFSLDPTWVQENIIPWFDIEENFEKAQKVWHGYLRLNVSRSMGPSITNQLEDYYRKMFPRVDEVTKTEEYLDRFFNHVALIAIYHFDDPLDDWVMPFVAETNERYPGKFAQKLKNNLGNMEENRKKELWEHWLKDFWELRIDSNPVDFSPTEAGAMGEMILELQPVVDEAVDRFCDGAVPNFEHSSFFLRLKDSELLSQDPEHITRLLIHATKEPDNIALILCGYIKEITKKLIKQNAKKSDIDLLLNNLAQVGCNDLGKLIELNQDDKT